MQMVLEQKMEQEDLWQLPGQLGLHLREKPSNA